MNFLFVFGSRLFRGKSWLYTQVSLRLVSGKSMAYCGLKTGQLCARQVTYLVYHLSSHCFTNFQLMQVCVVVWGPHLVVFKSLSRCCTQLLLLVDLGYHIDIS